MENESYIKVDDLIKILEGYGTYEQPITIGLLKDILIELNVKQIRRLNKQIME